MAPSVDSRARSVSAAAICAAMAMLNLVQVVVPGGQPVAPGPGLGALAMAGLLLWLGQQIPARALLLFGPAGTALIALAIGTTPDYSDAAVLYMLPAVWVAYFYGVRATVTIVVWTAIAHGLALVALPTELATLDRWLDVTAAVAMVAAVVRWIAERNARLTATLSEEARVDKLTGLLNRRGFDERFALERLRAGRYDRTLSAVCFDIDHFKAVNDRWGHEMGDRVLQSFGALLAESVRSVDVAARTGGEEFTVLLPETDAAEAEAFAERIRAATTSSGAARGLGRDLDWTVSAGVACATSATMLDVLVVKADQALYEAKARGRNRVVGQEPAPAAPR